MNYEVLAMDKSTLNELGAYLQNAPWTRAEETYSCGTPPAVSAYIEVPAQAKTENGVIDFFPRRDNYENKTLRQDFRLDYYDGMDARRFIEQRFGLAGSLAVSFIPSGGDTTKVTVWGANNVGKLKQHGVRFKAPMLVMEPARPTPEVRAAYHLVA